MTKPTHDDAHGSAFKLSDEQNATLLQMEQALQDQNSASWGYVESAFKRGVKHVDAGTFLGLPVTRAVQDGSVWCCPRCLHNAIQALRDHADLLEDVAKKLNVEAPNVEWQRKSTG